MGLANDFDVIIARDFVEWRTSAAPPVSPAGFARLYFDGTTLLASENGGAYGSVGGGGGASLSATLAIGNTTGANDIVVSTGQEVIGAVELGLTTTGGGLTSGVLTVSTGNATGTNSIAGDIEINGGDASGTGSTAGSINLRPGDGETAGWFQVFGGSASPGSGQDGGGFFMEAGAGDGVGQGGSITLLAGQPGAGGIGGDVSLSASGGIGQGGSIFLTAGSTNAGGTCGNVEIAVDDSGGTTPGTVALCTTTTQRLRFYGNTAGTAQQTVTGSRGGNAALADFLTKLATLGLIVDGTSA